MSGQYGLIAEFPSADELVEATKSLREQGYRRVEAYSPFPVEGLDEAIGFTSNRVPLVTLIAGTAGGAGGFFMQWYSAVVSYPFNIGGRPTNSWPAFIPVVFELTILCAALAAFFGMWWMNGLPRLRHPVFDVPRFQLATRDRFFLCVRTDDPEFTPQHTREALQRLEPLSLHEVPL